MQVVAAERAESDLAEQVHDHDVPRLQHVDYALWRSLSQPLGSGVRVGDVPDIRPEWHVLRSHCASDEFSSRMQYLPPTFKLIWIPGAWKNSEDLFRRKSFY